MQLLHKNCKEYVGQNNFWVLKEKKFPGVKCHCRYSRFLLHKINFQPVNYLSRKNLSKELGPVGNDAVNSSLLAVPLAAAVPIEIPIFHTGSQQTERKRGRKSIAVNAFNQVISNIYIFYILWIWHLSIYISILHLLSI